MTGLFSDEKEETLPTLLDHRLTKRRGPNRRGHAKHANVEENSERALKRGHLTIRGSEIQEEKVMINQRVKCGTWTSLDKPDREHRMW